MYARAEKARKSAPKEVVEACAHPGCIEPGEYRAPKSRKHADQENPQGRFQHFCLDHIREHNSKWDFFATMTPKEVEQFQREAITGHRKTKPVGLKASVKYRNFTDAIDPRDAWLFGMDEETFKRKTEAPKPPIPKKERWAMSVFDMDFPFTQADVKTKYRQLAQRYHPDKTNGDRTLEEKFKEVTEAYGVLKNFAQHLAFA